MPMQLLVCFTRIKIQLLVLIIFTIKPTKVIKLNKNSKEILNIHISMLSCKWEENYRPNNKSIKKYSNPNKINNNPNKTNKLMPEKAFIHV